MGRPRNRPAEFPTDWHWERHHEDLLRGLAGAQGRLAEAKSMSKGTPYREELIEGAENEVAAVEAQLEHYGWGSKQASKRPAKAQSKR